MRLRVPSFQCYINSVMTLLMLLLFLSTSLQTTPNQFLSTHSSIQAVIHQKYSIYQITPPSICSMNVSPFKLLASCNKHKRFSSCLLFLWLTKCKSNVTYSHLICRIIVLFQVWVSKCLFNSNTFVRIEGQHLV